ncbi:MAG: MFS transporter [Pseudomonadota bacterium]
MTSNNNNGPEKLGLLTLLCALAPFSAGYFLSYLLRGANAIIEKDLVAEIGLGPADLGLVTAAYLGGFALFQLPLGILLDKYGPRRVQTFLLSIAGLGALAFAYGQSVETLIAGRALIGLGFAGGLMASFKAVVIWIPEQRRALANALVMCSGAVGLLLATQPLEFVTQMFGWRDVFVALAVVIFALSLLIFTVVPEREGTAQAASFSNQLRGVGSIFADRRYWAITPLLATTSGAHVAIQTLWAGPWLRDVGGLAREAVAEHLLIMAIAFFCGILLTGVVADWFVRRGFNLLSVMIFFVLIYLASQIGIVTGIANELMLPVWFVFGMLGQVAVLAYPWLAIQFGAAQTGRAHTAVNLAIFGAAFTLQYVIGAIIEQFPSTASGAYAPEAYQTALGATLVLQLLALAWYFVNFQLFRNASVERSTDP